MLSGGFLVRMEMARMRIHLVACRILSRELSFLAAQSANQVDLTWVGRGLHNTPEKLRSHLSDIVDGLYDQRLWSILRCSLNCRNGSVNKLGITKFG